jgi:OOP family OmpA-OmpF porin
MFPGVTQFTVWRATVGDTERNPGHPVPPAGRKWKLRYFALLAVIASLAANPVAADDRTGVFLGVSGGAADLRDTLDSLDLGRLGIDVQYDDDSPAWSASGGYQLNRYFGARFGYVEFQTFDDRVDAAGMDNMPDVQLDLDGWQIGVDAYLPVAAWVSLAAHAGYMDWQSNLKVGDYGLEETGSGTDPFFGGGMELNLGDHVGMDLSYTRFDSDGSDVDYAAVGVRVRF